MIDDAQRECSDSESSDDHGETPQPTYATVAEAAERLLEAAVVDNPRAPLYVTGPAPSAGATTMAPPAGPRRTAPIGLGTATAVASNPTANINLTPKADLSRRFLAGQPEPARTNLTLFDKRTSTVKTYAYVKVSTMDWNNSKQVAALNKWRNQTIRRCTEELQRPTAGRFTDSERRLVRRLWDGGIRRARLAAAFNARLAIGRPRRSSAALSSEATRGHRASMRNTSGSKTAAAADQEDEGNDDEDDNENDNEDDNEEDNEDDYEDGDEDDDE